ncbi:hypothetical protein L3D22_01160 [Lysobacter soli]|uniref:hypothetical protein n=1 Tax=Lysobacter soli TaxID=453783 RepID=UPI0020A13355|nr:hypothetical protein [Lysobacter soli]UTA54509.1 hypothetical protein L3D22_01160 [Lysobacter soli]
MKKKNNRTHSERTEARSPVSLSITALPFVADREQGRPNYWAVEPVDETPRKQIEAQRVGAKYAVQYAQWLKANPDLVGMGTLGWIAADIDFKDPDRTGYWIGFFSCVEQFLFDTATGT